MRIQPYPRAETVGTARGSAIGSSPQDTIAPPNDVQLWDSILAQNIDLLKKSLETGAYADFMFTLNSGAFKVPPLIAALLQGHENRADMGQMLLDYAANPTARDARGTTVYKYAIETQDHAAIRVIVVALQKLFKKSNSDAVYRNIDSEVTGENEKCFRWDLALAIINNEADRILLLMKTGPLGCLEPEMAYLHLAVIFESREAVDILVIYNASPFKRYSCSSSPICIAIERQYERIVGIMLSKTHLDQDLSWVRQLLVSTPDEYLIQYFKDHIFNRLPAAVVLKHVTDLGNSAWVDRLAQEVGSRLFSGVNYASEVDAGAWRLMEITLMTSDSPRTGFSRSRFRGIGSVSMDYRGPSQRKC